MANDCSTKISNEHWLSDNIIDAAGGGRPVIVSGVPWQTGQEKRLSLSSMGAKILCDRHNNALSKLDTVAGQLFRVLHHYQEDLREKPEPHGNEFALFHGDLVERWMLKFFEDARGQTVTAVMGRMQRGIGVGIFSRREAGGGLPRGPASAHPRSPRPSRVNPLFGLREGLLQVSRCLG